MTAYDNKEVDTGEAEGEVQQLTADLIRKGWKIATMNWRDRKIKRYRDALLRLEQLTSQARFVERLSDYYKR
ncbi:hypothetical protein TNCV_4093471 [Trichonephila clavipes]|nr:hypothetical protein TNCV_4093471 [Trichonephila clavipes]